MKKISSDNNIFYLVIMSGFLLIMMISWLSYRKNIETNRDSFNRIAEKNYENIVRGIDWHTESLVMLSSYFKSSQFVSQQEYNDFVKFIQSSGRSYRALGWIESREKIPALSYLTVASSTDSFAYFKKAFDDDTSITDLLKEIPEGKISYSFNIPPSLARNETDILGFYFLKNNKKDIVPGYSFILFNLSDIVDKTINSRGKSFVSISIFLSDKKRKSDLLYKSSIEPVTGTVFYAERFIKLGDMTLTLKIYPSNYFLDMIGTKAADLSFYSICLVMLLAVLFFIQTKRYTRKISFEQQKADEANRLKNDFLATMSHEIRSPMSGVLGMAELLMNTNLTPDQRGYTKTILSSGETLMNIIEDILDFSKIEANKLRLDPVPVNLMDLVDDVSALYNSKAREKAIELAVRYVPGIEQFIYADPVRLQQILGNLINNAIKFTDKGYVLITVSHDETKSDEDNTARICFSVQDTGIGISQEAQTRIFEKFMQAETSTTRDYGGTGLGLSICKRLTEMMNGTISVTSKPAKGSIFTVSIPFLKNVSETYLMPRPPELQGLRVLVVDDLDVVRTLVREQLNASGLSCDTTGSSEEALMLIRHAAAMSKPYQIILIDYLLPGMNGEMLARALGDETEIGDPCLVMVTSAGVPISNEDIVKKGFSAFICKPLRHDVLINTISAVWQCRKEGVRGRLIRIDNMSYFSQDKKLDSAIDNPDLIGRRILLAEDSRINQAFAEDFLGQLGCIVKVVSNGKEAILAVQADDYDLVLMDCQMPIMDGFEASREIKLLKDTGKIRHDLPILALTANAMKGDKQKCLDAGMDDYLAKPVRTKDLKEKVTKWITRQNHTSFHSKQTSFDKTDLAAAAGPIALADHDNILDPVLFSQARQMMKGKFAVMIDYYCEDVALYLDEMITAYKNNKPEDAIRPVHTIKSTSLRMGATALSKTSKLIEEEIVDWKASQSEPNLEKWQEDLANLHMLFEKTKTEMRSQINSKPS